MRALHPGLCAALCGALCLLCVGPASADEPPPPPPALPEPAEPDPSEDSAPPDAPPGEDAPPADAHHREGEAGHAPERIVVTATPIEHDRDELAIPVHALDRAAVLEQAGATLGETLARMPGISTSGFTGGASRPVIRGQDAFRTGVVEDGLPTQDVSRESPDHAVPINPVAVERIEVVRGPATLRYGGGASAGVVNSITNRVPGGLPEEPVSGAVFGAFDTVANRRDVSLVLDGALGSLAYHVDGLLRDSDDFDVPDGGDQDGTFAGAFSGSAGASYFFPEGSRLGGSYTRHESDYGIPEEDEDARIDLRSDRVRFEGDWCAPLAGISEVRVRGLYSDYRHREKVDGVTGQTFDLEQFDGRLELVHDELFGFLGAAGLTGEARSLKARGEAASFLAPTDTTQVALYLFEERELMSALVGELGFRVEYTGVEGTPAGAGGERRRDFVPLSGSLGLVYLPREGLSLGLTGAASQRAPAEVELFARGPHEATETFEVGDPDLDEETSFTGEAHVTFERPRLRLEVAGFVTWYRDYISGELTGDFRNEAGEPVGPGDDEALRELFYRHRDALFAGAEVAAELELFEALRGSFGVDGQFDYVRARFTSGDDRDVPRIPPIRWGGGLFYRGDRVRARVGFLRHEKQSDVAAFETTTGSFTFLNAEAFVRLSPLGERFPVELGVQGANLTNAKGRNHVSFNADELQLPGWNVRGTVRASF